MAGDPFQDLLQLEDEFYKEGYDAGVTDSAYAGMIEGKVFGIEKGYEKALELAKMHGRALVWKARLPTTQNSQDRVEDPVAQEHTIELRSSTCPLNETVAQLDTLSQSSRLQKNIESLLALTESATLKVDNSDDSVTEFDDRLAKAKAKAKVIANVAGESLYPAANANTGIEDATGLNARH